MRSGKRRKNEIGYRISKHAHNNYVESICIVECRYRAGLLKSGCKTNVYKVIYRLNP